MRKSLKGWKVWAAAVALCAMSCRRDVPARLPDIVLIGIDTWRADHFGGDVRARLPTPHLEALARDGVSFGNAVSPVPLTLPAFCSAMTGLVPPRHGVRDNDDYRLGEKCLTLAEVLRGEGYRTHAVVAAFVLDSRFGMSQGFETYDDAIPDTSGGGHYRERTADEILSRTLAWLEKRPSSPFFLFIHFFDPHAPYAPPEPYRSRFENRPYAGEVAFVDECVGKLLRGLRDGRLYDDSLIIAFGDHGESLGEHGEESHGYYIYDSTLRIPLIVKPPRGALEMAAGRTVGGDQVCLTDVFPTVLDALGLSERDTDGTTLWPMVVGAAREKGALPADRYAETVMPLRFGWSPLAAIRREGWKYIEAPKPELYHLESDAAEKENVIEKDPGLAREMRAQLKRIADSCAETSVEAESVALDSRMREALDSLGYVKGRSRVESPHAGLSEGISPVRKDLRDPKETAALYGRILAGIDSASRGDYPKAIRQFTDLLEEAPEMDRVRASLGYALFKQGDYEGAVKEYRKSIEDNPVFGLAYLQMGEALIALGRTEEAEKAFVSAATIDDAHRFEARMALGNVKAKNRDYAEAVREFEKALTIRPRSAECLRNLAVACAGAGRSRDAREYIDRSLVLDPSSEKSLKFSAFLRKGANP